MLINVFDRALDIFILKLENWLEYVLLMMPNFISALLVVILFFIFGKYLQKVLAPVLAKFSSNQSFNRIIIIVSYFIFISAGIFVALGILRLDKAVTSLLAGAGIIGLALGLAFQDIAINFVSGLFIALKKPIVVGDLIASDKYFGTVTKMDLRSIHIRTQEGQFVIIPAKEIFQKPVTNYTSSSERRVDISGKVSYDSDLRHIKDLLLSIIKKNKHRDESREPEFFYCEFDESSVNFEVRFWLKLNTHFQFLTARSEAIMAIHEGLRKNGIEMPYPVTRIVYGRSEIM